MHNFLVQFYCVWSILALKCCVQAINEISVFKSTIFMIFTCIAHKQLSKQVTDFVMISYILFMIEQSIMCIIKAQSLKNNIQKRNFVIFKVNNLFVIAHWDWDLTLLTTERPDCSLNAPCMDYDTKCVWVHVS